MMIRYWVIVSDTFDAAHHLPGYKGKCQRVHGHTYKVELGVNGIKDIKTGMVVDMALLKAELRRILDIFDHRDLNRILTPSTAENIAGYILTEIQTWVKQFSFLPVVRVRVWETPDCSVEVFS